ncbi:hypothetical protein BDF19DRAFT_425978 [Syncephalis fuscata]|nr:hypothetical protein BDF19DRAFT_425978 [Syncephalis fuscata]
MSDISRKPISGNIKEAVSDLVTELLDECVLDAVVAAHREARLAAAKCGICRTRCRAFSSAPGLDIFGQKPMPDTQEIVECTNCKRQFVASRYAPHLEKCLGIAGRNVGRAGSRRGTPILDRSGSNAHPYSNGNGGFSGGSGNGHHSSNSNGSMNSSNGINIHSSNSGGNSVNRSSNLDHRIQTYRPSALGRQARRSTTDTSPELQIRGLIPANRAQYSGDNNTNPWQVDPDLFDADSGEDDTWDITAGIRSRKRVHHELEE